MCIQKNNKITIISTIKTTNDFDVPSTDTQARMNNVGGWGQK